MQKPQANREMSQAEQKFIADTKNGLKIWFGIEVHSPEKLFYKKKIILNLRFTSFFQSFQLHEN